MTRDEMFFVSAILSELAEGVDTRIGLRIDPKKIGHRPSKMNLRWAIALEVQQRVDEDEAVGDAIRAVAKVTGRTIDQVRIDHQLLKSKRDKS